MGNKLGDKMDINYRKGAELVEDAIITLKNRKEVVQKRLDELQQQTTQETEEKQQIDAAIVELTSDKKKLEAGK